MRSTPRRLMITVGLATMLTATSMTPGNGAAQVPFDDVPRETWYPNARVNAIAYTDDRVYIGGDFTALRNPQTGAWVTRNRLAAIDPDTGALITSFNPSVDDRVRDIEVSADGSRVFLSGRFGSVSGGTQRRVAAVDATTGALISSWHPNVNGRETWDLEQVGSRLFVGGAFSQIDGETRRRVAALDVQSGDLTPWTAVVEGGPVKAIESSPDGALLYLGGNFSTINGDDRLYIGAVSTVDGSTNAWNPGPECINSNNPCYLWDLAASGDQVFAAVAGPGGRAVAYDATSGATDWFVQADGNVQAVAYGNGIAYFGGHYDPRFGSVTYHQIAAVDAVSGEVLSWAPNLSRPHPGIWDVEVTPERLLIGGAFRTPGMNQEAYGQMELLGAPPVEPPTTEPPTTEPPTTEPPTTESVMASGATWSYEDSGVEPQGDWKSAAYDDGAWDQGAAQLGFGDGDEATVIESGHIAYYFRSEVDITDVASLSSVGGRLLRDDGAIVYVNGVEVFRSNMPSGPVTDQTRSSSGVSGGGEDRWYDFEIPTSAVVEGRNVVVVEVHNRAPGSSDISMDLSLSGTRTAP